MKFLADRNIESEVINFLKSAELDVIRADEVSDVDVLQMAFMQNRFVLTTDKDFINYFRQGHDTIGIIIFRIIDKKLLNKQKYIEDKINVLKKVIKEIKFLKDKLLVIEINYFKKETSFDYYGR